METHDAIDQTLTTTSSSLVVAVNSSSSKGDSGLNLVATLWFFSAPVIFVVGICGNVLVLVVMTRRRMSGTTTSVHLSVMAVADITVLISGLIPDWLEAITDGDVIFKNHHPVTCKLEKFVFYTSGDTSIWVLVIFTVDRFSAICFPLQKRDCWLPSRAKYYALGAFLLAITKNVPVFWTRGAEYRLVNDTFTVLVSTCGRPTAAYNYYELFVRPWIALLTVNVIPFAVILVCNVFIIRALFAVQRLHSQQAIASASDKSLIQMTTMCLSASFCFLICITPSIVLLIGRPYWKNPPNKDSYEVAKAVNNQLVFVNHSINFFLYCITGQRFRQVIASLCCNAGDSRRDTDRPDLYRHSCAAEAPTVTGRRSRLAGHLPLARPANSTCDDGPMKGCADGPARDTVVVELLTATTT